MLSALAAIGRGGVVLGVRLQRTCDCDLAGETAEHEVGTGYTGRR